MAFAMSRFHVILVARSLGSKWDSVERGTVFNLQDSLPCLVLFPHRFGNVLFRSLTTQMGEVVDIHTAAKHLQANRFQRQEKARRDGRTEKQAGMHPRCTKRLCNIILFWLHGDWPRRDANRAPMQLMAVPLIKQIYYVLPFCDSS